MDRTITLKNQADAQCKPDPQTIRNILSFSKAYECKRLESGLNFEMIRN